MLQHLILDIGNVICEWNPHGLTASAFDDPAERAEALSVTIQHEDWLSLDRGTLKVDDAIARAQARTTLDPTGIAQIYANLCNSLTLLPESSKAMHRADSLGVPVYILSNMQTHAWDHLRTTFDCFSVCDGVVVSCDTGFIKPEAAIYDYLCSTYNLTPESCVFVDDMAENIQAAKEVGMQGVQLTDPHDGGRVIDELVDRIMSDRAG